MSKGDTVRPHNKAKYDSEFDRIFGKREPQPWNTEQDHEQEERPSRTESASKQHPDSATSGCTHIEDAKRRDCQPHSRPSQTNGEGGDTK